MIKIAVLIGSASFLAACSRATPVAGSPPPVFAAPYNTQIDVHETMIHVIDPAARAFWAAWGEVADEAGSHDVSAKTDAEWKKVEDGAAMVVLATNTLMLPDYRRQPEAEWNRWAKEVADLAMKGKEAAEAKDISKMEVLGGQLDIACDECHKAFRTVAEPLP